MHKNNISLAFCIANNKKYGSSVITDTINFSDMVQTCTLYIVCMYVGHLNLDSCDSHTIYSMLSIAEVE
jgi:hypothetical protein